MSKEENSKIDRLPKASSGMSHIREVLHNNVDLTIVVEQCKSTMGVWDMSWKS